MFNRGTTGLFGGGGNTSFGGSAFGAAAPTQFSGGTTGGFGTTGFGVATTPAASSTGLFGGSTAAPASGGLFGQNAAKPTGFSFGTQNVAPAQSTTGLFGSTATSGFGATAAPAQQTMPFGGSLFGGGGAASTAGPVGTTVKFVALTGSDIMMKNNQQQSVATKLQCITGMKEYESKSLEELRLEDYAANRKGPQPGAMGFGAAPAQTSQGFSFSGFGASTAGSTVFGQPQAQQAQPGGGLFGTNATAKPLFGSSTTTTSTAAPSLFGNTAQNPFGMQAAAKPGLFGATATTQSGGLFGSNPTAGGGLFGSTQPAAAAGSIFGTSALPTASTGSVFGAPTASVAPFGATGQTTGGLFGQAAKPAGGMFGQATSTTQSTFGFGMGATATAQPTLGGGLFGAKSSAPTTGFSFATPAANTGFGMFGAASSNTGLGTAPTFNTGGLNTGQTGLFGQNKTSMPAFGLNTASTFTGGTGFGGTLGTGALTNTVASGAQDAAAAAAVAQQQQLLQQQVSILNSSPYGDSPLFRNLKPSDGVSRRDSLLKPTNPAAQKAALEAGQQFKVQTRMTAKVKPTPVYSAVSGKGQLFDGLEDDDVSYDTSLNTSRRSVKKLVIKSNTTASHNLSISSQQSIDQPLNITADADYLRRGSLGEMGGGGGRVGMENGVVRDRDVGGGVLNKMAASDPITPGIRQGYHNGAEFDNTVGELNVRGARNHGGGSSDGGARPPVVGGEQLAQGNGSLSQRGRSSEGRGRSFSFDDDNSSEEFSSDDFNHRQNERAHKAGIVLRRPGYYTVPSLDELEAMVDEKGHCFVDNFVIGRENYGSVSFPGVMDVSGLNIDELVHFRSKEIDIYPSDDLKPAVGEGLNRPAQVTLDRVWPVDKSSGETIRDYDRLIAMHYMQKLERASYKIGAQFIEYRPETGSWVFQVKHFSKYRLPDDLDDDDENIPEEIRLKRRQLALEQKQQQQQDIQNLDGAEAAQVQQADPRAASMGLGGAGKGISAPLYDDDSDSYMTEDVTRAHCDSDLSAHEKSLRAAVAREEDLEMENVEMDKRDYLERTLGASAYQVQLQKASFFGQFRDDDDVEDDDDDEIGLLKKKNRGIKSDVRSGVVGFVKASPNTLVVDSSLRKDRRSLMLWDKPSAKSADLFNKTHSGVLGLDTSSGSGPSTPRLTSRVDLPSLPTDSYPLVPSGLALHPSAGSLAGCRVAKSLQPFSKSLLAGRQSFYMDTGLVQGRTFRSGWATNWKLTQIGQSAGVSDEDTLRSEDMAEYSGIGLMTRMSRFRKSVPQQSGDKHKITDWQSVALGSVDVGRDDQDIVMLKECLLLAWTNSEWTAGPGGPVFNPKRGLDLLSSYNNSLSQHPAAIGYSLMLTSVWSLCKALWGQLDSVDSESGGDYLLQLARREALSGWLTETSKESIYMEVKNNIDKGRDSSCSVLSYLSGRLVSEACECAAGARDLRLALLVAQASSCDELRQLLWQQLAAWADVKMDDFIDMERLKIVSLLAGQMVWQTSSDKLNVCEGLDWKRCLALHLWYKCSANASIEEALQQYEKACGCSDHQNDDDDDEREKYAAPPSPSYLESVGLNESRVHDVTYHLLKLYTDRSHPLNVLLNPHTMTGNQLDYSLSWHLMCVLESLGFTHISEEQHSYICHSYAAQLEAVSLYDWAAFVLLHIRNTGSRKEAVTQLLTRHLNIGGTETEEEESKVKFLIEQLHIPSQWIHLAKSVKAHYMGDVIQEAWHLLKSDEWNKCHDVVVNSIASDAVVNDEEALLELYLTPLAEASHVIKDWSHGGLVYSNYFTLKRKYQQFREITGDEVDMMDIEELGNLCFSLADRISRLSSTSATDRLSRSKILKSIADVVTLLTSFGALDVRQSTIQVDALLGDQQEAFTSLSHMSQLLMLANGDNRQ